MLTNTSNPTRFCPTPIHGERTAKIIQADGIVEYPGCTIVKDLCTWRLSLWYPHFDKDLNMRINFSPCCRKLLVELTHHIGRVLNKHNITYFLVGGTVISLVRENGKLIPYDTDTDFAIDARDLEKFKAAFPELEKPGYAFRWKTEYKRGPLKRYMVGCTNKQCELGPGIAFYVIEGDMIVSSLNWHSLPANLTIPPIKRMFEGLEMGFPKEPEKYLDYTYAVDAKLPASPKTFKDVFSSLSSNYFVRK
ncbi:hypothetical protein QZH41_005469 [Actinostola sp. cb2023]|nr:hypothetical protein QZH41_005469 [Actinostola sp. cb2023]